VDVLVSRRYQDTKIEEAHREHQKQGRSAKQRAKGKAMAGMSERGRRAWGEQECVEEGGTGGQGHGRIGTMGLHGRKFESKRLLGMKNGRSTNERSVNNSGSRGSRGSAGGGRDQRSPSPVRSPSRRGGGAGEEEEVEDSRWGGRGGGRREGGGQATRRDGEKQRGFDALDDAEVRGRQGLAKEESRKANGLPPHCIRSIDAASDGTIVVGTSRSCIFIVPSTINPPARTPRTPGSAASSPGRSGQHTPGRRTPGRSALTPGRSARTPQHSAVASFASSTYPSTAPKLCMCGHFGEVHGLGVVQSSVQRIFVTGGHDQVSE
jgi:hypothetical protein